MVFGPFSQGKLFLSMAIAGKKEQAQFAEEAVMRHWGRVVGLTLSLLFFAVRVAPQGGATGAISGIVQDPSGGVIGSAKVEIVSEATGQVVRDLITDSSGSFTATFPPCLFRLKIFSSCSHFQRARLRTSTMPANWAEAVRGSW